MKKKLLELLLCCSLGAAAQQSQLMVISDPHVLAPSFAGDGPSSANLVASETKLVAESPAIVDVLLDSARRVRPAALLIAGDLTYNGERASHEWLADRLKSLRADGVPTFVVPGNHDVRNPHAVGGRTVTSDEFAAIYGDCGYVAAIERDTASLSYVAPLSPGVTLLAIDSNRYDENRSEAWGDSKTVYRNAGRVKPATRRWAAAQIAEARSRGDRVVVMMHHHLLEHIDGQARLLPNYIVEDRDKVAEALAGADIVLTGHLHITDAVELPVGQRSTVDGQPLMDVATGSATTWPFPYRVIEIGRREGARHGQPFTTTLLADNPDCQWSETGRRQLAKGVDVLAAMGSKKVWSRMGGMLQRAAPLLSLAGVKAEDLPSNADGLKSLVLQYMREPLTEALFNVTRGGEDPQVGRANMEAISDNVLNMLADMVGDGGAELIGGWLLERVEPLMRSALLDLNDVGTDRERRTEDLVSR